MKLKYIICTYSLIFLSLILGSCKKFLEEKADKKLVEVKSLDDLQALLDDNAIMNENTPGFGEASSDDYFVDLNTYNSLLDIDKRAYSWRLSEYRFQNNWSMNYNAIYNANYCLDYLKKIQISNQNSVQWNNVYGSALFHRAFRNLCLIWEYGMAYDDNSSSTDLGIVLRLNSDPTIKSVRASVKQSYEQIIKDAMESVDYLPNYQQHVMRPSKAAAYGLLARAYLSMRKYDSAYKYSDLCLQIKNDLLDYNDPSQVDLGSIQHYKPFNSEIVFNTIEAGDYACKIPLKALIDTTLFLTYSDNDLRKIAYFFPYNGYQTFIGNYNAENIFQYFTGIATDEMYLTRSECHARAGRISEAMNDLTTLLNKRWVTGTFVPYTATNQQQAINIVLLERRKELLMRGLRWIDLKRLNKEGANIALKRIVDQVYTLAPNNEKYALPLPKDITEQTGIQQNSGW